MATIDQIKKESKEQGTFLKASTPVNLRVFLREVKETGEDKKVTVLGNDDYNISKEDDKTLRVYFDKGGVTRYLWFVPIDNLNIAYKEV